MAQKGRTHRHVYIMLDTGTKLVLDPCIDTVSLSQISRDQEDFFFLQFGEHVAFGGEGMGAGQDQKYRTVQGVQGERDTSSPGMAPTATEPRNYLAHKVSDNYVDFN